jgi:sialate O-acetylesterase
MRMNPTRFCLLLFSCVVCTTRADVRLHALFTDNMVLQRGIPVPVWGWADDGEAITVQFGSEMSKTTAKDGKWMVHLKPVKSSQPSVLTVSGKNTITLTNVVGGEVWVASGQSNMEWPMSQTFASKAAIAGAAEPMLRLFTVKKLKALTPTNNCIGTWDVCTPQTIPGFSAVAYYFALDLQKSLGVPVGIIHTSWGGSPAEVWMSQDVLAAKPDYKYMLDRYPAAVKKWKEDIIAYDKEEAEAKRDGKEFKKWRPWEPWRPTELYDGMLAPIIPFAIKGAIWYQGESNADRAQEYRSLFTDMVKNWRHDWKQGDFTFLQVQLAPFMAVTNQPVESAWAELREAQVYATKALPNVGIAVITDVGEELDIHPKKKGPVGGRLALAARSIAYGEKLVYSGPSYKSMKIDGDNVILSFDQVGSGLVAKDGELKGFSIAGADKKFVWAKATIVGDNVIVQSLEVAKPIAVRYGWANYPVVNLWNKEGLPASPFRTDDFPMITAAKK